MSMNDPLADMLTRIRNGQSARLARVSCPKSKLLANVLQVLKSEGYIRDYASVELGNNRFALEIDLKYHDGEPVIREISRVSKPGRRMYSASKSIPVVHNGLGITVVSTSHGVMADHEARRQNIGGEVLCSVF